MLEEFEFTDRCMGCTLDVSIIAKKSDVLAVQDTYTQMRALADMYEEIFSRFLPASELSRLNARAGSPVDLSKIFSEVFITSEKLFVKCGGYFNSLTQVSALGYTKTFTQIQHTDISIPHNLPDQSHTDFNSIAFDALHKTLQLQKGQQLDFGGFLKGYVAQKIALLATEYTGVIVNLGGDIFTLGTDADGKRFTFSVYNPVTKKDILDISLCNEAMATSGNYKRVWRSNGKTYSHIVDAQTHQNPETDLVSATIVHKSSAVADAYATVAMTLTSSKAQAFFDIKKCQYIFITTNGDTIHN